MLSRIGQGRRTLVAGTAMLGAAVLAGGPASIPARAASDVTVGPPDPRLADYKMPPEDAPHERTFMQWPVSLSVYGPRQLDQVQAKITLIANTISQYEPVVLLVPAEHADHVRTQLSRVVEIWQIPTDDLWCRDAGPTFVKNAAGHLAVAHIHFNGWGGKQQHGNDRRIAEAIARRLGVPFLDSGLIGEAGGVEHDGAGTLLAHASCWANPNRNGQPIDEIGRRLVQALGAKKIIWAPGLKGRDITDYHIDALARFVSPGRVLIQLPEELDPQDPFSAAAFQTYQGLKQATDAQGRRLEIIVVAEPKQTRSRDKDFVASYVNYYVCNNAVIAAQFGDQKADARAKDLLRSLYPGRQIVTLDIDAIGMSGGGIHCATQQQPTSKQ